SPAEARPCCIPIRTRSGRTNGPVESRIRASSRRRMALMSSPTRSGTAASPASPSRRPGTWSAGRNTAPPLPRAAAGSTGTWNPNPEPSSPGLNGTYWMYFNVPDVLIATSDNLVDWTPLEDSNGRLVKVLSPRPGYFDSWLVEAGPPALITEHGILVLYNAGNSGQYGDPGL